MWFRDNIAQARGGFSSDHRHAIAAPSTGNGYSWTMRRSVARGWWRIRYWTGVLVADAPSGLATDENCHARRTQQWRSVRR
jgi:hypothetical protein